MTNDASTFELFKLGLNIGAILLSSGGIYLLTKRDRGRDRLEDEKRADRNALRARIVYLERFERWVAYHFASTGIIGRVPPWAGGFKSNVDDSRANGVQSPDDWPES